MCSLKQQLKRIIQIAIATSAPIKWKLNNNSLLILMYHRIIPENTPYINNIQPGMYVHPETFRMHLDVLKSKFEIVHLDEWIQDSIDEKPLPKNACAITFDDGWLDNYTYAYPILKELNIPAIIYLVSNMIGSNKTFWPERLSEILCNQKNEHSTDNLINSNFYKWIADVMRITDKQTLLEKFNTDDIINKLKQYSDTLINEKLDEFIISSNFDYARKKVDILNKEQVLEMQQSGLIKFGSHTCNHLRLSKTDELSVIQSEIIDSKKILVKMTGSNIDSFCYPNGDRNKKAEEIVRKHYLSACTTQSGWNNNLSDIYSLKRIGIHQDISKDKISFLSRISGWI